jgi:hypothetical protein
MMPGVDRRKLLRASAATALAGVAGARPVAGDSAVPATIANGTVLHVDSRSALARLDKAAPGQMVFLAEQGREGMFRCVAGPNPTGEDPLQGLFLPAGAANLHYERIWDGQAGRPEWFGARPGDPQADCADAIEACYALCPVTELAPADYFIRRTLRFSQNAKAVRGTTCYGQQTRVVLAGTAPGAGSVDILFVGTAAHSGPEDTLTSEIEIANLALVREAPCVPPASGEIDRYPAGLRASYLLRCTFRGITSLESSVGFHIGGVVYTKFFDCFARRTRAGTHAAGDRWIGYYLNGHVSFGYAGGNASLYMDRCLVADQHGSHVDPTGLLATGAFVDSFIDRFESARIDTGMAFLVDGARGWSQTIDLHIHNPVLDGCGKYGIDLSLDATSSCAIEITDPYIASAGPRGDRGILVHDGAGVVTITGGQIHGHFEGGSLYIHRTRAVTVQGLKIENGVRPVVVGEAGNLVLEPQINNYMATSTQFAISCDTLSRSILRPVVVGAAAPAFRGGISLGPGCHHCHIDGTGIDPGCFITPDPRYKLWFAGADAREGAAKAAFAAAGNVLSGVTG